MSVLNLCLIASHIINLTYVEFMKFICPTNTSDRNSSLWNLSTYTFNIDDLNLEDVIEFFSILYSENFRVFGNL